MREHTTTSTVVEGIENMPTPPPAHHEHASWVRSVIGLLGSTSHANGTTCEVSGQTGSEHDPVHPAGECLKTDHMMKVVLTAGKGAQDSVAMLECRAGGAGKVSLDRNDCADLLLNIWVHSELNRENGESELLRTEITKLESSSVAVPTEGAADELGTVGGTGDPSQRPGLQS